MSSAYNLPDYCAHYFEYNDLDKIHGELDVDSIVKLLRQVQLNAQPVSTTQGGGRLGYLALVIPSAIYDTIPSSARFTRSTNPGTFLPVAPIRIR